LLKSYSFFTGSPHTDHVSCRVARRAEKHRVRAECLQIAPRRPNHPRLSPRVRLRGPKRRLRTESRVSRGCWPISWDPTGTRLCTIVHQTRNSVGRDMPGARLCLHMVKPIHPGSARGEIARDLGAPDGLFAKFREIHWINPALCGRTPVNPPRTVAAAPGRQSVRRAASRCSAPG